MAYPLSVFNPSVRSNGQTIDASHVNDLQNEVTAVETAMLGTITHSVNVSGSVNLTGGSSLATLSVSGASTFAGSMNVSGASSFTGDIHLQGINVQGQTAISLSAGDNHDVVASGGASYIRVATNNAGSTLTGLSGAGSKGRLLFLSNVGPTATLGLKASSGSISSNQFLMNSDTNVPVGGGVLLMYDVTAGRWWVIARNR